jgi:hypothetical protein
MPRLTLFTFPQRWSGAGQLEIHVLALPAGDPFAPLDGAAASSFAATDLSLEAMLVPNLAVLPKSADALSPLPLTLDPAPNRAALFNALRTYFHIAVPPAPPAIPPKIQVRKLLPRTYRSAAGISQSRYFFAVTDETYHCALESGPPPPSKAPLDDSISWGQILAYVLRQPVLAKELGMWFKTTITPPASSLDKGGWLFTRLKPGSTYSDLPSPGTVDSYAARIPALAGTPRPVFAAVLFPVDAASSPGYDSVFPEAEDYDDGFAKVVHASQPISAGLIDTEPASLPPLRDLGIRLGWDDEQIGAWMNRQLGIDPLTGAPTLLAAPMGVLGYRIDVRDPNIPGATWATLNRVKGPVKFGGFDLGMFHGELAVEAVPISLQAKTNGDYWLPPYFAVWSGGSVVLSDLENYRLTGQDAIPAAQVFSPVGAPARLRYGTEYEFRVRLMDLSSGGPHNDEPSTNPAPKGTTRLRFRRYIPPAAVAVLSGGMSADGKAASFKIGRPRLGYPAAAFTPYATAMAELKADRSAQQAELAASGTDAKLREISIPDPDVSSVEFAVFVRALAGDTSAVGGFVPLFTTTRPFVAGDIHAPLTVSFEFQDVHDIAAMPAPAASGAIVLPTARELRVALTAIGRSDDELNYFGSSPTRRGAVVVPLSFRAPAQSEANLLVADSADHQFQAIFVQPDDTPTAISRAQRAAGGRKVETSADGAQLLARQLALEVSGLTFAGKAGRRTVFGCSSALRHALAPDAASITFGAKSDLTLRWIIAVRVQLDRDWTWEGLATPGFEIVRKGYGRVGTITLPRSVNSIALAGTDRQHTDLIFFDAIDPKAMPPGYPAELNEKYTLNAFWRTPGSAGADSWDWLIRLPVAAKPLQTPQLISAGLAFSPYVAAEDYSSTKVRSKRLWLEFDRPPDDPQDKYYARVLAYAPDPLLMNVEEAPIDDPEEPDLPIPAEKIRVITGGQAADEAGLDAMQELERARGDGLQYLVPLPRGLEEPSPELLGFFVYELRVGHDASRWCLAHSRFGNPLRVTGVQHPAPSLPCQAGRTRDVIEVASPFATPVLNGRNLRPTPPQTDLWALLYAQVQQIDGRSWRNVLLARRKLNWTQDEDRQHDQRHSSHALEFGIGAFKQKEVEGILRILGLPADSPISVATAEVIPEPRTDPGGRPRQDPLGTFLGEMRILRTSALTRLQPICVQT